MSLQDWLKNGWLKEHQTSDQEIADLLALVDRDLAASQTKGLVPDTEATEMIAFAVALREEVIGWLDAGSS